jgi:hypothetical protein
MLSRLRRPNAARLTLEPRAVLALAATLLLVLAATGCGSSSTTSSATTAAATPPPALTKAQFVAQANAICARANTALAASQAAFEKVGKGSPSLAQINTYVSGVFAPSIQGQIDAIRALAAPTGEQATVSKMLALAEEDLNRVKTDPALLAGSNSPFTDFAKIVHPYGLTKCAAGRH